MSNFVGVEALGVAAGSVVVIDVFRAFTVAPLALALGAKEVILVGTLAEALHLKRKTPGSLAITDGAPREGFELSNSPVAVMKADLVGRTIFQRTLNGTRAALAAEDCRALFCASFVCASATAAALRADRESITYVISGEDGSAAEDMACAKFIDALIENPDTDAEPYLREARTSPAANDLREGVRLGYKGVHSGDIEACLETDRTHFALAGSRERYGVVLTGAGKRAD